MDVNINVDQTTSSTSSITILSAIPHAATVATTTADLVPDAANQQRVPEAHTLPDAEEVFTSSGEGLPGAAGTAEWIQGLQAQIELNRATASSFTSLEDLSSTTASATTSKAPVTLTADAARSPLGVRSSAAIGSNSTTNSDGEGLAFVPIPFHIVQIHENERVRSQYQQNTQSALLWNRKYQRLLIERLQDIQQAKERLKEKKDRLRRLLNPQEIPRTTLPSVVGTDIRVDPPYFIDSEGSTPADNNDAARAKTRSIAKHGKMKRWSSSEKERLREGVLAESRRILYEQYQARGDTKSIQDLALVADESLLRTTEGIDWNRIAAQYPTINNSEWTKDEARNLSKIVDELHGRDWNEIARRLGTSRTAAQCFKYHHIKGGQKPVSGPWTEEEDRILTEAVATLGENSWLQVADYLDGRTAPQCLQRWTKGVSPMIRRGKWTSDEDAALKKAVELIEVNGKIKWSKVQEFVLGRTDVQCRERYMNVLAPNISYGFWDEAETNKLLKLVERHGTSKWALIASEMGGRTDNQCWRRWKVVNQGKDRKRHWHPDLENAGIMKSELAQGDTFDQGHQGHQGQVGQQTASSTRESTESGASATHVSSPQLITEQLPESVASPSDDRQGPTLEDLLYQSYLGYKSHLSRIDQIRLKECHHLHTRDARTFESLQQQRRHMVDPVERVFNLGIPRKCFAFQQFATNYLPVQLSPYELRGPLRKYLPQEARRRQQQKERPSSMVPHYRVDEQGQRRIIQPTAVLKKMKDIVRSKAQQSQGDQPQEVTANPAADVDKSPSQSPPTLTMEELEAVATLERVCRMRPVPPCVSTVRAFSTLIRQGRAYKVGQTTCPASPRRQSSPQRSSTPTDQKQATTTCLMPKRFAVPKRSRNSLTGELEPEPTPYTLLSAEEQQAPEFQELMGRFEAVFLWPMLGGMLHLGAARKIRERHKSLKHVPGSQYPAGASETGLQGSVGDSSTGEEWTSSSDSDAGDDNDDERQVHQASGGAEPRAGEGRSANNPSDNPSDREEEDEEDEGEEGDDEDDYDEDDDSDEGEEEEHTDLENRDRDGEDGTLTWHWRQSLAGTTMEDVPSEDEAQYIRGDSLEAGVAMCSSAEEGWKERPGGGQDDGRRGAEMRGGKGSKRPSHQEAQRQLLKRRGEDVHDRSLSHSSLASNEANEDDVNDSTRGKRAKIG
ncbi:Myblike DNAbinding domain-containing protein [Actinomortierella ambigua]|nr:Myblike DNAbinding domain-containing protein [Actinomortierella ambigua]